MVYYENGQRFPREAGLIDKIAAFFNVSSDFLTDDSESIAMTKEEIFLEEAKAEDKLRGKSEAKKFIETTKCLFAGGELSEEDKDALFEVLTEIYFDSKKKAKKYGARKNKGSKNTPTD